MLIFALQTICTTAILDIRYERRKAFIFSNTIPSLPTQHILQAECMPECSILSTTQRPEPCKRRNTPLPFRTTLQLCKRLNTYGTTYTNTGYFSARFKEYSGMSPNEYRKKRQLTVLRCNTPYKTYLFCLHLVQCFVNLQHPCCKLTCEFCKRFLLQDVISDKYDRHPCRFCRNTPSSIIHEDTIIEIFFRAASEIAN